MAMGEFGRAGSVVLMLMTSASAAAQTNADDVVHAAVITASPRVVDAGSHPGEFKGEAILQTVTTMLTATPQRRAADVAVGVALMAIGTRPRHPIIPAVSVGIRAVRLGLPTVFPSSIGGYEVLPQLGCHTFALSIRKAFD
jgi:hypothetical protein